MKKIMKILILSLYFISSAQANDIRDFQIEGMSIGDSLLDFMSAKEIKKIKKFDYSGKYIGIVLREKKSSNYDDIQLAYKNNDDKYTIHSLAGRIFIDNIEDCLSKRKEIEKEISKVFPSASIKRYEKVKHGYDKSGKSFVWHTRFELKGGGKASIECHDWSKKIEEKIADKLMVGLGSNEFHKFVDNEAYR
tara:strand:- start:29 stop:604 length:576 start_codon:yes stop_codon:yes gene_type:complete